MIFCYHSAFAYRPFDSTDADVAAQGEFELEVGLGSLREESNKSWIAPAVVANFGLAQERELVIEGRFQNVREPLPDVPRTNLVDTGIFIKQILKDGVLQDKPGISAAMEYGVLLPEVHGEHQAGLSWAGIISQRWPMATIHLNAAVAYNREHHPEAFIGAIIEGPYEWTVRPAIELFTEQASGSPRVVSRLIGFIWRSKEQLSFDVGIRSASGEQHINEFRAGLTWVFK